jgi:hypothetical protein
MIGKSASPAAPANLVETHQIRIASPASAHTAGSSCTMLLPQRCFCSAASARLRLLGYICSAASALSRPLWCVRSGASGLLRLRCFRTTSDTWPLSRASPSCVGLHASASSAPHKQRATRLSARQPPALAAHAQSAEPRGCEQPSATAAQSGHTGGVTARSSRTAAQPPPTLQPTAPSSAPQPAWPSTSPPPATASASTLPVMSAAIPLT